MFPPSPYSNTAVGCAVDIARKQIEAIYGMIFREMPEKEDPIAAVPIWKILLGKEVG